MSDKVSAHIGAKLRDLRIAHGLTTSDIAIAARTVGFRWDSSVYKRIETGVRSLQLREFAALPVILATAGVSVGIYGPFLEGALRDLGISGPFHFSPSLDLLELCDVPFASDATRKMAVTLRSIQPNITAADVDRLARDLWGESLEERRDRMTPEADTVRSRQAHRGHVTRELTLELAAELGRRRAVTS